MSEKGEETAEQEADENTEMEEPSKGSNKRRGTRYKKKKGGYGTPMTATAYKGEIASIKDHVFVFNQIHSKKWITARKKFINYAAKTYGGNEETSLELKKLTVVTVDSPIAPTTDQLKAMDDLEREFTKDDFRQDKKTYKDAVQKTKLNLTKLYKALWGQCDPIMKNKIKAESKYKETHALKSVIGLLSIIETVCEQGDTARKQTSTKVPIKEESL